MSRLVPLSLTLLSVALVWGCSETHQPDVYPTGPAADDGEPAPADGQGGDSPGENPADGDGRTPGDAPDPGRPSVDVTIGAGAPVDIVPDDTLSEAPSRARRRMDLDQLAASLVRVTDGIGWTVLTRGEEVDQFEALSRTLGKPDFVEITTEDLEPSALFQKFLDDAARSVCAKVVDRDVGRLPAMRLLAKPSETDEQTLMRLLLRFHGRWVEAGAPELESWQWLIQSATHVTGSPEEAWRAVCVALITHPDFYSY